MVARTRIHIIHVGSTTNIGTYALLKAEVSELKRIYGDPYISVSTGDVETLKNLEPDLKITPPLVNIPYESADSIATKNKKSRKSWIYKLYLLAFTLVVGLQTTLSLISSVLLNARIKSFYRSETLDSLKRADLIVSTADENFKEGSIYFDYNITWKLTWWFILFSKSWCILISKKIFKKPVLVFPNSVGPFRTKFGRFITRNALNNVDFILLRENLSLKLLRDLGVTTPSIKTTDIAILLGKENTEVTLNSIKLGKIVGISPGIYASSVSEEKKEKYLSVHGQVLDWMIEKYDVEVLCLPLEITSLAEDDYFFCQEITKRMTHQDKVKIVNVRTLEAFKTYLATLDMLISSRMHPLVLAASEMIPTLVVAYDHKQTGFLHQLGLDYCAIDINEISFEKMLQKAELVWNDKEKIRAHLQKVIPMLQNDVRTKIENVCIRFLPNE